MWVLTVLAESAMKAAMKSCIACLHESSKINSLLIFSRLVDNGFLGRKLWTFREHGTDFHEHSWTLAMCSIFVFAVYAVMNPINAWVCEGDRSCGRWFFSQNVHEIVHDSFLSFVNSENAVITWDDDVFEFYVSGIFMNNWAILIFVYLFSKCHEHSVRLAWWHLMDSVCF